MTATAAPTARRLYRSTRDKKVAGVCGGIAEAMGWDVTAVRLVAALSILLPGPQALAYLVAWLVMPTDREVYGWDSFRYDSSYDTAEAPPAPPVEPVPPMPTPPHTA
ncbi:PspC domain-containing protein [Euzebya sp.]|uniref:PspC domain-containing protein n=1 Tax=Euzebya sp. TaxID=1971409 RepID=UPI0035150F02